MIEVSYYLLGSCIAVKNYSQFCRPSVGGIVSINRSYVDSNNLYVIDEIRDILDLKDDSDDKDSVQKITIILSN